MNISFYIYAGYLFMGTALLRGKNSKTLSLFLGV